MQGLQVEARKRSRRVKRKFLRQGRNAHRLLGVWQRNDCSVQANAGASGILSGVLPATAYHGGFSLTWTPITVLSSALKLGLRREECAVFLCSPLKRRKQDVSSCFLYLLSRELNRLFGSAVSGSVFRNWLFQTVGFRHTSFLILVGDQQRFDLPQEVLGIHRLHQQ